MQLTHDQRVALADLLQSRLSAAEQERAYSLQGLTAAESARQNLLQDADDAGQRTGMDEVDAVISDIQSGEYNAMRDALTRIHGAGYGLCTDCRAAISFERLRVEPAALRCTDCETLHEQGGQP